MAAKYVVWLIWNSLSDLHYFFFPQSFMIRKYSCQWIDGQLINSIASHDLLQVLILCIPFSFYLGRWVLTHKHTQHMGCGRCNKSNESYTCGLDGGNMLCSKCFSSLSISLWLFVEDGADVWHIILFCLVQNTVFKGQPSKPDHSNVPCAVFWYSSICMTNLKL